MISRVSEIVSQMPRAAWRLEPFLARSCQGAGRRTLKDTAVNLLRTKPELRENPVTFHKTTRFRTRFDASLLHAQAIELARIIPRAISRIAALSPQ